VRGKERVRGLRGAGLGACAVLRAGAARFGGVLVLGGGVGRVKALLGAREDVGFVEKRALLAKVAFCDALRCFCVVVVVFFFSNWVCAALHCGHVSRLWGFAWFGDGEEERKRC